MIMPLKVMDYYADRTNILSERLRQNWLQKISSMDAVDDSLTNLTWLHDMHPVGMDIEPVAKSCSTELLTNPIYSADTKNPLSGSLMDPRVRYEYRTKWTGKPPFSYATLICLAMRELGKPKVTLSDIYGWIMENFAYYRHTDSSWQNSVRHNLSLNKCFEKVPRDKSERGKGGFWRVNPKHLDWLEANLAKCRRAAPPPGPPPPIPRSWLYQQQQQQQQQRFVHHISSKQVYGNVVPMNHLTGTIATSSGDQPVGEHLCATTSPTGNCNTSFSSSSPSTGSLPSPHGWNNIHGNQFRIPSANSNGDTEFGHVTSSTKHTQFGSHRRKSPVRFQIPLVDDEFYEPNSNGEFAKDSMVCVGQNIYKTSTRERYGSTSTKFNGANNKTKRLSAGSNAELVKNDVNKPTPYYSGDVMEAERVRVRSPHEVKQSTQGVRKKQAGQAAPTRILPPRARHSRWSRQRNSSKVDKKSVTGPQATRIECNSSQSDCVGECSPDRTESRENHLDYKFTDLEEYETDADWPPSTCTTPQRIDFAIPVNQPNPSLVTPHYVPAGLSPNSRWCVNHESNSSSASSSSMCSVRTSSDGQMYRTVSPGRHSNPRRVESQTITNQSTDSVQLGRLYPVSYEAERLLACSPNHMGLPKWAAVFLPENEQQDLEPLFEKPTGTDPLSTQSESKREQLYDTDQQKFHSHNSDPYPTSLTSMADSPLEQPVSTNPILESLDLDPAELDFEALNGLVESTGPIPLDLDFGLTAHLQTPDSQSPSQNEPFPNQMFPSNWCRSETEWYTDDQHYLNMVNEHDSEFQDVDDMFDKSVEMRRQFESDIARLNTPPSQ